MSSSENSSLGSIYPTSYANKTKLFLPSEDDVQRQLTGKAHPDYDTPEVNNYFAAMTMGDMRKVEKCLDEGVPINAYDLSGKTILHIAATTGNIELAEIGLRYSGNLDQYTLDFRFTPLHLAVQTAREEIVELFLEEGAKINLTNGNGTTAVHMAVRNNDTTILSLLLNYKPRLNVVDMFSNTPLSIATLETQNYHIAWILLKHGSRVNTPRRNALHLFHEAVLNCMYPSDIDLVRLLIKHGASKNFVDPIGRNALHYAAIAGMSQLVRYLLKIGVNPNLKDKTGRTPYDMVLQHKHREAAQLFVMKTEDL